MTVRLRAAGPGDLEAVVGVFLRCWRESYAAALPATLVRSMSDDSATDLWRRSLSAEHRHTVLAVDGESVCGVVGFGADGQVGRVHSLYVSPSAQGSGIGATLLSYASRRLAQEGCGEGQLWVFAANAASIAFYRRHGWRPDGAQRVEEAFGENEVRLSRALVVAA